MSTQSLSVNMPQDIIAVHGTVNGVGATFSLAAPGVWSTVVLRSPDFRYVVAITAYNSLGTPAKYNIVLYYADDILPIRTNWTSDDYYNFGDLDRVEANVRYLAQMMESIGHQPSIVEPTDSRDMTGFERNSDMSRVEGNIRALADDFYRPVGWVEPKTSWGRRQGFSYIDANRLERNILLMYDLLTNTIRNDRFCGTFACGEELI